MGPRRGGPGGPPPMKVDGRRDRMPPREPKDLRDRPLRDERNDGDELKQGVVIRGRGRGGRGRGR